MEVVASDFQLPLHYLAMVSKLLQVLEGQIDRLEKLKNSIDSQGGNITIQELDVTKKEDCNSFAKTAIETYGNIDILINNAGIMPLSFQKFED